MSPSPLESPLLLRLAGHPPDSVGVVDADGARTSYGALTRGAAGAGRALRARGLSAGGAVVFLVEPGALFVETLLAIWRAGGIAVPLSPHHTAPELTYVVENAAPMVLVASRALGARLEGIVPPLTGQACLTAEALMSFPVGGDGLPSLPPAGDDALMLYTSGTTGRPKGVRLTHAALAA